MAKNDFNMPALTTAQIAALVTSVGGLAVSAGLGGQDVFNRVADIIQTGVPTWLAADMGLRWHRGRHADKIALAKKIQAGELPPEAAGPAHVPPEEVGEG